VQTVREDLQHLMDTYGSSPALLRIRGLPVYYLYDSYRIPADAWAKLLSPAGDITVRGTNLDGMYCS
jgi:glycoprotein endo-alpha-1,2-mannosidase